MILYGNATLQNQITTVQEAMPNLAEFIEKDICGRMDSLDQRIKKLEMQTCRCGLEPKNTTQDPEGEESLNGKNCTINGKKWKGLGLIGKNYKEQEVANRPPVCAVEWNQGKEQGPSN